MAKSYRLALIGFGNVGRAFARLLLKKEQTLREEYDVTFKVTGISTGRHGYAIDPEGIDLRQALALVEGGEALESLDKSNGPSSSLALINKCQADVLIETTPVNAQTGLPAIDYIKAGLERGMHAVTANKGPVVHGFGMLNALAKANNRLFLFESAVMDGAPIFSLFREPLIGAKLLGFYGILNSCTNLLLDLMAEGKTLEEAISYSQSIGITETDPSNDVDGWDAAIKVAALCTVLMNHKLTPQEVDRIGIRGVSSDMIAEAKKTGKKWKLVCSAGQEGDSFKAVVKPQQIDINSPLYSVNGTSSFVMFKLDVLPGLGVL
ncbi:MAG: homoserine dehydrogenase, partial [Anaerolineaceae bacterium]|nr:homoserine dehydrogenase [Anaerolineaceae bacterium]